MRRRTSSTAAALALIGMMIAGCSGQSTAPSVLATVPASPSLPPAPLTPGPTPTPSPVPTASPAPSPSPTPIDVAAEFVRQLAIMQSYRAALSGEVNLGVLKVELSGEIESSGQATRTAITAVAPDGSRNTSEKLDFEDAVYESTGGGPFIEQPRVAGGDEPHDFSSLLAAIVSVRDMGIEVRDGRSLHHLVPPADIAIDPALFGLSDDVTADALGEIEFYAEPNGRPAIMIIRLTWQSDMGGQPVTAGMTMELTFSHLDGPVVVTPPSDPWRYYSSTRFGLTAAHPASWYVTFDQESEGELIMSPGGDWLWVWRGKGARGLDLRVLASDHLSLVRQVWADGDVELTLESARDYTIAGHPARIAHLVDPASSVAVEDVIFIVGNRMYVAQYAAWGASRADSEQFFSHFLATVVVDD